VTLVPNPSTGTPSPAERELQAQRLILEHAQRLARIGHWEFAPDGTTIFASSQVLEIFDLPADGPAPSVDKFRALVPPSELDQVTAALNAMRQGLTATPVRHRVVRADRTVRWVDHSFDFRPGPSDGTPILMGVMQDVTDEVLALDAMRQSAEVIRQSSEAIRESDERQREALRIARASLWTWDRRTRLLSQSHDLYEWLGYESAPDPFDDRIALRHPDDREPSRQAAEGAIRQRVPYVIRYRLARAGGGWAWIEGRGEPVFDGTGEFTGYRGTAQDISEQVKREEALRESDDRQREALHIARASVWVWDRRTRIFSESDDLYQMLGYEVAPASFDDQVALRYPDDREPSRQFVEDAIRRRVPYTTHYRVARPAGGWAWIEGRGIPQFDEQGELTGYRGTRQDVTEQREAESRCSVTSWTPWATASRCSRRMGATTGPTRRSTA